MRASANVDITAKSRKQAPTGMAMQNIDVAASVTDPAYRGEIKVVMVNRGPRDFKV